MYIIPWVNPRGYLQTLWREPWIPIKMFESLWGSPRGELCFTNDESKRTVREEHAEESKSERGMVGGMDRSTCHWTIKQYRGMDGVLSAHREGLHRKSALLGPLWPPCKLRAGVAGLADGRQARIGETEKGRRKDGVRGRFKGLFLSHQSWYLRARARPGTIPKARRKENLGFTQRTSRQPLSPRDPDDHSSDNNIRADDVGGNWTMRAPFCPPAII